MSALRVNSGTSERTDATAKADERLSVDRGWLAAVDDKARPGVCSISLAVAAPMGRLETGEGQELPEPVSLHQALQCCDHFRPIKHGHKLMDRIRGAAQRAPDTKYS